MKRIALHHVHEDLGAKMVPFAGFEMPVRYSSDKEEHLAIRESVGVFDVSHMGEFLIKGPNSLKLIQKVTSNDASNLINGQAQYSCFPNETGGIIDDLIVYKFGEDDYMMVVNASNIEKDWNWVVKNNTMNADIKNVSDDISLFAVQGPKASEAIQPLTDVALADISFYHFVKGTIAGIEDVIISGTGYTGSGGFELYVPNSKAELLWNEIFKSGKHLDIKPIGLGARDTLRMEMGYCLYGNDIDDTTSPLEAGLGWITKLGKEFINSENIKKQKEEGVSRKLIGLKMLERGIPRQGYPILDLDGNQIGVITSGTMSPSLNLGIGMGYVQVGHHQPGTEVLISIRNKNLKAEIVKPPFVKTS